MASAILTSGNGPRSSNYMSKFTNSSNNNLNFMRFHNIQNPNPNPDHYFFGNTRDVCGRFQTHQHLPSFAPPQPAFIRPPINSVPANSGYWYVTFRLRSYTRTERLELKQRLISDLERVRILRQRLCSSPSPEMTFQPPPLQSPAPKVTYHPPPLELSASKMTYHRPRLEYPAPKMTCHPPRLEYLAPKLTCHPPRLKVAPKMMCPPSRLELSAPPDVQVTGKSLEKTAGGRKRTNPVPAARDTKKQCARITPARRMKTMMRECGQILGKLMTHKHGWVFNTPVDAVALKLFDYHNIINNPMDLGTIKSKLAKNEYQSPLAFASDARLTFHNAMIYNGKGSNVFIMAERLLLLFENMFNCSHQKPANRNRSTAPVRVRVSSKPEMTDAEKSELATRFMDLKLGREGMDQIMEIVKKGVLGLELEQHGDEIELDLGVLDNDTLWGLHGFITNMICSAGDEVMVEEDVDIGEEMESTVFTPVEIEKDVEDDDVSSSESSSECDSASSGGSGCND